MGEALFELEQILRSKQEKLTSQETNVLMACKADALREFTVGGVVAAAVSWLATRRLSTLYRINLSAGSAAISAFWRFDRSLDSSVEHILSSDGSRMQMELANIILRKYGDNSTTMRLITKHFYSEKVFDDSSTDQPKIRWRYRNFFSDNVALSQRTHNGDAHGYGENTDLQKTDTENTNEPKHVPVARSPDLDAITNPFDCVFGVTGSSEEIHPTSTSSISPKRHGRSHKRSHRRHRMRHHEASSKFQHS